MIRFHAQTESHTHRVLRYGLVVLATGSLLQCIPPATASTFRGPSRSAAPTPHGTAWNLGTISVSGNAPGCPHDFSCSTFTIDSCARVWDPARGYLAVAQPTSQPTDGLIMFFTGGYGTSWWNAQSPSTDLTAFLNDLRAQGFEIAQVRWEDSWLQSSAGDDAGIAHLGCRPATVIRYTYRTYYVPLGIAPGQVGQCGFCLTGNSGGATQITDAVSFYGLASKINAIVPSAGPPHAVLATSCLRNNDNAEEWLPAHSMAVTQWVDPAFGYFNADGPCFNHDVSFTSRFLQESTATGGTDYNYPNTRVQAVFGALDTKFTAIGMEYVNRLISGGSPYVSYQLAANTSHDVYSTVEGRFALRGALLWGLVELPDKEARS